MGGLIKFKAPTPESPSGDAGNTHIPTDHEWEKLAASEAPPHASVEAAKTNEPQELTEARRAYAEARKVARNELNIRKRTKEAVRTNLEAAGEKYRKLLQEHRLEQFAKFNTELRVKSIEGKDAQYALTEQTLTLLKEEDERFNEIASELDKGLWTKFINRWQRHPGARIAIGAGLSVAGFLTGGAGVLAVRSVWSGVGTMVGVEGAIERYSKTLGQKGLVDDVYEKAKYPRGRIKDVTDAALYQNEYIGPVPLPGVVGEPNSLGIADALSRLTPEQIHREMARLRMLRELKGVSLERAGRKGEATTLVVSELRREEERMRREKIQERLRANPENAGHRALIAFGLLEFLDGESKAMEAMINDANDRERVKSIKRKAIAVAAGFTVGMFVGRKGLGKLAEKFLGDAETASMPGAAALGAEQGPPRMSPSAAFGRGRIPEIFPSEPSEPAFPANVGEGMKYVAVPEHIADNVGTSDTFPQGVHVEGTTGPDPGIPRIKIPEASEIPVRPVPRDPSEISFRGTGHPAMSGEKVADVIHPKAEIPVAHSVAEGASPPPAAEHMADVTERAKSAAIEHFTEKAEKGDSVWKMTERTLGRHFNDFEGLNEAQKRYVIDAVKDKIVAHPDQFGLTNPDQIAIGQEIDFSKALDGSEEAMARAQGLSKEAQESIMSYRHGVTTEVPAEHAAVPERIPIHEQLPSMEHPGHFGGEFPDGEGASEVDTSVMERVHEEMAAIHDAEAVAEEAVRTAPIELTGYNGWRAKHWIGELVKHWDNIFTEDEVRENWLFGMSAEKTIGSRGALEKFITTFPTLDGKPTSHDEAKQIAKIFHKLFEHLPDGSLRGRTVADVLLSLHTKGKFIFPAAQG